MKIILVIGGVLIFFLILGGMVWFFLFQKGTSSLPTYLQTFGTAGNNTNVSNSGAQTGTSNQTLTENNSGATTKIFEISAGPVTGATFVQTLNPTTTLVRFVTQEDGHVYDFPIDVPGAVLRPISDTTIPGTQRALWVQNGSGVILQYLDADNKTIKTVYVGLQQNSATSTLTSPQASKVQFFPDNITDIAVSPDGSQATYVLPNASGGASGYLASADGSGVKSLFSTPLTQLLISWPAPTILLLQTPSSADVPGIVFEVGTKSGSVLPLVYGEGITAIANKDFSDLVYQTRFGASNNTYLHILANGGDVALPVAATPEQCVWDAIATTVLYCANPTQVTTASYLDLWHQGTLSLAENILSFNILGGITSSVATPGSSDGGVQSDIAALAISPDDHYLLYITKGDRSLWGVRLTQ